MHDWTGMLTECHNNCETIAIPTSQRLYRTSRWADYEPLSVTAGMARIEECAREKYGEGEALFLLGRFQAGYPNNDKPSGRYPKALGGAMLAIAQCG